MTVLVIAEHDKAFLAAGTLNVVTAAIEICLFTDGEVHLLLLGHMALGVAEMAAQIVGVSRVIHANRVQFEHGKDADEVAQVLAIASCYSHILFPDTATGKNIASRVATTLDVVQITDISKVDNADTFKHLICAKNGVATMHCTAATKIVTVQTTAFDAAAATGGFGTVVVDGGGSGLRPWLFSGHLGSNAASS